MINFQQIGRLIIVLLCACSIFLSLAGCEKNKVPPPQPADKMDIIEKESGQLTANVYIDSTVSMEGFVRPSSTTNYIQTLQAIESAISTGWKTPSIHFFKFGTKILPLKNREHLNAVKAEFYQTEETKLKTHIEKVINSPNTSSNNSLTIIVTDLFQNDADVSLLTNALNEKCAKKNFAIGILGIRSQYDGTVYDVGIKADYFDFKSIDAKPETFRPFYLLILGKQADVANYFERLKSGLSFISNDTFVIFSRYIVNQLASFEGASVDEILGRLQDVTNIQDSRVKQFRIQGDTDVGFTATLKYNQLPYAMPYDAKQLQADIIAEQYEPIGEFKESRKAYQSLKVDKIIPLNDGFKLKINLTPTTLPGDGIYRYEIIVRPTRNAYNVAQWWNKWNMDLSKIDSWKKNPKTFDGSKTFNLNLFMDNLWQANYLMHQPKIARVYCYFKK
ncbi:MAG: hypothetical protein WC855_10920 [Thermodesulfovibrionales bacterium]